MDFGKVCQNFIKGVGLIIFLLSLTSCTAITWVDGPSGRSCKAHCKTWASNGEACVEWSETASDACVGKYSPADYCCTNYGKCRLYVTGAKGFSCFCEQFTPYGIQRIPGQACN